MDRSSLSNIASVATCPPQRLYVYQRCHVDNPINDTVGRTPLTSTTDLAQQRGWRIARFAFTPRQLQIGHRTGGGEGYRYYPVIDHAEYFLFNCLPVAILSHSYAPIEKIEAFAREWELVVELLPYCWYARGKSRAITVIFTRVPR